MMLNPDNPRAVMGGNNPPEATPFEQSKATISDLFEEAKNWCAGEPIASQEQADEVQKLLRMIQAAEKEADERRVAENKPFDDGKAEVQARYAPLIANTKSVKGMTVLAVEACKKALTPWLVKVDAENRAKAAALAAEAEAKAEAAREAMRQRDGDLEKAAAAETLVREAKDAEAAARKADNAKASAKGEGRAVTLRTRYIATIVDPTLAARHYWITRRPEVEAMFRDFAQDEANSGVKKIPGFEITEERVPV